MEIQEHSENLSAIIHQSRAQRKRRIRPFFYAGAALTLAYFVLATLYTFTNLPPIF